MSDVVAISIDGFVTNRPETIAKIMRSKRSKRAQPVTREVADQMARIFGSDQWRGLAEAPSLVCFNFTSAGNPDE